MIGHPVSSLPIADAISSMCTVDGGFLLPAWVYFPFWCGLAAFAPGKTEHGRISKHPWWDNEESRYFIGHASYYLLQPHIELYS